ncbi:MAG: response regulator transcription factor [Algoriella sp.]|uniref:LytR/AlgR family response regulator transcription factor n=1 Tax=Algoriella sp. TaxID=1872434 RepID=UPI002FC96FC3
MEDEMIIAASVSISLEELGYEVTGIVSEISEIKNLKKYNQKISLALLDINLGAGNINGIEVSKHLKALNIPFVYLTSYGDKDTLNKALETKPLGYIMKPVTKITLYSQLELAFSIINQSSVTIEDSGKIHFINLNNILYIQAEGNYSTIYKSNRKIVLRKSLKKLSIHFPEFFIQIHKSYLLNSNHVESINETNIVLKGKTILPLSRHYKQKVLSFISIK